MPPAVSMAHCPCLAAQTDTRGSWPGLHHAPCNYSVWCRNMSPPLIWPYIRADSNQLQHGHNTRCTTTHSVWMYPFYMQDQSGLTVNMVNVINKGLTVNINPFTTTIHWPLDFELDMESVNTFEPEPNGSHFADGFSWQKIVTFYFKVLRFGVKKTDPEKGIYLFYSNSPTLVILLKGLFVLDKNL